MRSVMLHWLRASFLTIAVLAILCLSGCDSAKVEKSFDTLIGRWALSTFNGVAVPVWIPDTDNQQLLKDGNLTIRADQSWTIELFGSTVKEEGDVRWDITWSGTATVANNAANLTIGECSETGAARTCLEPSVVGVVLRATDWSPERIELDMRSDDGWIFGFSN